MNFSSIRVFARLRAGSQEASHATVATGRGDLRLPSLTSVFNQAEEIPMHRWIPQKSVDKLNNLLCLLSVHSLTERFNGGEGAILILGLLS